MSKKSTNINGNTTNGNTTNKVPRQGLDILLQRKGKALQTGQKISFTLIKGPSINRDAIPDPVNPSAPKECFPLIAKFPESVVRPEFSNPPWTTARLYQQDVPKAQIDSDEEAEEAAALENRKRWRRKRNEPPKRQWVLQEQVEFLETMMAKRQKKQDIYPAGKLSSRYEGMPEHNPSHYVLLECAATSGYNSNNNNNNNNHTNNHNNNDQTTIQVTLLPAPPNANVTFSQPAARKALTMSEAEQAIQDQRNQMTRYMMHNKNQNSILANAATAAGACLNQSKARLLGKLIQKTKSTSADGGAAGGGGGDDNDGADDIMADVAFRDRKGNTKARKELLSSLGDDNVKVDDDGVLGGAHDDEFGGKRHFGTFKVSDEEKKLQAAAAEEGGHKSDKGNAGMAMEDGFYQRDVKAEYEELDYDVDEQFDDDDVDVGETEVAVDGGFAQEEEDEDEDAEDMEGGGETITGAEGLASVAGFKAMLAKARGDTTDANQAADATANGTDAPKKQDVRNPSKKSATKSQTAEESHLDIIFKAAEKFQESQKPTQQKQPQKTEGEENTAAEVGPDGLRLVTLQAVRKEIWLNHGQIPMKRLMKLFKIGRKSSAERQNKFREVLKELCIMTTDPVGGRMLVLKQHYSNMG